MLAIAAAILVGLPIATVLASHGFPHLPTVPGGEVVDANAEQMAEITDVMLADPPQFYGRNFSFFAHEQLVEGHTVFATVQTELTANVSNATLDITGMVECSHHVNASGPIVNTPVGGVPVFNRVHEAHEECRVNEQVFVTPDPFLDPNSNAAISPMSPTGNVHAFQAPNGVHTEAVEYDFEILSYDALGNAHLDHYYAWSVPIFAPWTGPDGEPKAFYAPLPTFRLIEMGITDFTVIFADDPRLVLDEN